MSTLPLEGVTVLEFTHIVMGPSCGMVLADLGADVIRVEPVVDAASPVNARNRGGGAAGTFYYFNRNKRCVCINLKSPSGLAVARDLVRKADVLIENFAPGTLDRLGLGWDAVHELNPRLVYLAMKGFLPGPYEHRPSLDELAQFGTGLAYMTGPPGQPLRAGASVVDIMGGVMGVIGVLAALRQRDSDGVGQKVTSSLYESAAFLVGQHMATEGATGTPSPPMPVRRRAWPIYETFPTKNSKELFIAITSDSQWRSFCRQFERPDLAADARFTTSADRLANRPALRDAVAAIAQQHDFETMSRLLDAGNIPFAPVGTPSDLFDDPQLNAHDRLLPTRMPQGNVTKLPTTPICFGDETPGLRHQPPAPGEHTNDVLQALGYDKEHIATLRESGVVG